MPFPLYEELLRLAQEADRRWPEASGFQESISLPIFRRVEKAKRTDWYFCTPKNAYPFSATGGGGTHFSFVSPDGVDETTPVAVTSPSAEGRSFVVGANLLEFLRFGCLRGFFGMSVIGSKRYQFAFGDTDWYPGKDVDGDIEDASADGAYGFGSGDAKEEVLAFLRSELGLTPIEDTVGHFEALQISHGHLVGMSQREMADALSHSLGEGRVRRWFRQLFG